MKQVFLFLCIIFQFSIIAQRTILGKVTDKKSNPVFGANVYLDGTYDGGSTNEKGEFSFETAEKATQTLVTSFVSFETYINTADVSVFKNLQLTLRDDVNSLDAVVINAGIFEAGEKAKVTVLKPSDIVTTASAMGDFVGYDYKNTPNTNGNFDRQAIVPNADSFFFVGFFWTISDDKKSNQLDNL